MKQYFVITFLFTQLFAFDGYLRQNEVSSCQDECSQYYIEPEIDGGFGTVPIFFQDSNINIELYMNRFVEIDLGQEVTCVECSAFEVLEIQLSTDCDFVVECFVDPCSVAEECGINTPVACEANYCGGCNADFYDLDGNLVDCSLTIENNIEGRWHLVGYEENVMYQFEDNYRYSIYSTDGTFGDIEDAGGSPNPYAVQEDIITIDLFFGTIVNYQMNFMCDGQVVEFKNIDYGTIHSTHFREGYDYQESPCNDNSTLGDLNGDGIIDILDIILLVNIILADEYNSIADLNEDGELNILDVVIMVNLVLYDEPSICDGLTEVELWGGWYDIESTTFIGLQGQGLTGSIPPEIGCLTNLTNLWLYNNQLTGEIPVEIGSLTNLTFLDLYNNQLIGTVPPEIGSLTNLIFLSLLGNQLAGGIPQVVCDLIESNNLDMTYILEGNNLINTCE